MKVVLFCGGLGTRLREHSDTIPKPLVNIGFRPIIWHLMRYYAHFGHKDFVLCLGYRGDLIREYFLKYNECMSNDFVLSDGGRTATPLSRDIEDWRITFVDTGLHGNIGQRLLRVKEFVDEDEAFLANYADGLSDLPMNEVIENFCRAVRLRHSLPCVRRRAFTRSGRTPTGRCGPSSPCRRATSGSTAASSCCVARFSTTSNRATSWSRSHFSGSSAKGLLRTVQYRGFWQAMDTFKDKITFDRMEAQGRCPWMVWKNDGARNQG